MRLVEEVTVVAGFQIQFKLFYKTNAMFIFFKTKGKTHLIRYRHRHFHHHHSHHHHLGYNAIKAL